MGGPLNVILVGGLVVRIRLCSSEVRKGSAVGGIAHWALDTVVAFIVLPLIDTITETKARGAEGSPRTVER